MGAQYGGAGYAERKRAQQRERDSRPTEPVPCAKCSAPTTVDFYCKPCRAEYERLREHVSIEAANAWVSTMSDKLTSRARELAPKLDNEQRAELKRIIACKRPRKVEVAKWMSPLLVEVIHNGSRVTYGATRFGLEVGVVLGFAPPSSTAGDVPARRRGTDDLARDLAAKLPANLLAGLKVIERLAWADLEASEANDAAEYEHGAQACSFLRSVFVEAVRLKGTARRG